MGHETPVEGNIKYMQALFGPLAVDSPFLRNTTRNMCINSFHSPMPQAIRK